MYNAPYRDHPGNNGSNYDLQDYYESVPPAHRLSGMNFGNSSPGNSRPNSQYGQLPTGSSTDVSSPFRDPATVGAGAAGAGAAGGLGAAATAADLGPRRAHYGDRRQEMSMTNGRDPWSDNNTRSGRRKWIVVGVIGAAVLVVVAIVLGVVLSKKNSSSSSSNSSASNPDAVKSDPNNPSSFEKDSRLKQSFYGIAYTPEGSQLPDCGNKLADVITDIQLLSQLTTRIRLYGADCNQSALVLEAIKQTKVNMTVYLGNYPIATDSGAAYVRQRDVLKSVIQTYGTDHISGLTVGNEFILNYLGANGGDGGDPNGAIGDQGGQALLMNITDTKNMLSDISVSLPIGNADAGSFFNNEVLAAVNYGMANVHPWFANISIDAAAGWTWDFFQNNNVDLARTLPNNPQMSIAETGWPSASSDAGNESNGPSTASEPNLQTFMKNFVCPANANGTEYFYFEAFDEPWKDAQFGGVEGHWGLFYSNRTLKSIEIPDCSS